MSLHHDRLRAQHGHPLHQNHTEHLETGIAHAVHEIDELRNERDQLRAAVERVEALYEDWGAHAPRYSMHSALAAKSIRAALDGTS